MLRFQISLRLQVSLIVCLIAAMMPQQGVESLLPSPTQEAEKSSISSDGSSELDDESEISDQQTEEERIQAEVADIMAIRKQLGGGVAATLGDFSVEMPGAKPQQSNSPKAQPKLNLEDEFAKQLATQSRNAGPPLAIEPTTKLPKPQPDHSPASHLMPMDPLEKQESIRHAARMLEEAAAALEEAGVYDRADQIRGTAGELWRSAR